MSMKWGRFFENFGNILEKIFAEPGSVFTAKTNTIVRTELCQVMFRVIPIVSVYTNGRTVQSGTAHWSASKPDRSSKWKVQSQKLPILCGIDPLYSLSESPLFSVSVSTNFIHVGDCWKK